MRTICESTESFISFCNYVKNLSPNSIKAYEADLNHVVRYFGRNTAVDSIDSNSVKEYIKELFQKDGFKKSTIKRKITTVKQLFKWLERENAIEITPFHNLEIRVRLPHRLPRSLSVLEMNHIINRLTNDYSSDKTYSSLLLLLIVILLFVTGLRIGELIGAQLVNFNQDEWSVLIEGKGCRERKVYFIGQSVKQLFLEYHLVRKSMDSHHGNIFILDSGELISQQYIRRHLKKIALKAGVSRNITPHMLRHTAATQLIEAGVDIRFVQKLLGHASIATTQIYTQVSDMSLRQTLENANTLSRLGCHER